jgi:hypothetical protein
MNKIESAIEIFVLDATEEAGYKKEINVKCVDSYQ